MTIKERNPDGLITDKPIALRLMPDERAEAERIADHLCMTLSCLARLAFLAGLPSVAANDDLLVAPSATGLDGGGHPPAAAVSFIPE